MDVGRRLEEERLQIAGQPLELRVDPGEGVGVPRRDRPDLRERPVDLRPPGDRDAFREGDLQPGLARDHPQAAGFEVEVADHLGTEHAGDVGGRRGAAPRGDLLGDAAAADHLPPLEDQRGEAGAREIRRRRQAVVAPADHNRVACLALRPAHALI